MDFAVPADHRIKTKENKNRDKYQHLARELKKQRNMKMTVIPIVIGAHGMIPKGTGKLRNQKMSVHNPDNSMIKIGQNTEKEFWRLEGTCCVSNSSGKLSANAGVKNS